MGSEWVVALVSAIGDAGAPGIALFVLAYVIAATAMLPGSLLTLGAGFVWGPVYGLLIASPASVLAATVAFVLGRTVLRGRTARWLQSRPRISALDTVVQRDGFRIVLLLRLSPLVPFDVLNYALSLSSVRVRDFVVGSALGMLPWTAVYVYVGSLATAAAELGTGQGVPETVDAWLMVGGGLATVAVAVYMGRRARAALKGFTVDGADAVSP